MYRCSASVRRRRATSVGEFMNRLIDSTSPESVAAGAG
jgi:hypothetical protein